jgi:long-chain acyl-CoA synthetase
MLEQPWIRNYDAGIPAHLDYPTISIQELLDEQAAKYPDRVAIVHDGESINYRQLGKDSRTFAANLIRLGLKPGERVNRRGYQSSVSKKRIGIPGKYCRFEIHHRAKRK